jgi:hypothetical protein
MYRIDPRLLCHGSTAYMSRLTGVSVQDRFIRNEKAKKHHDGKNDNFTHDEPSNVC